MRLFLTWLLAIGLLAGLGERVLAAAAQAEHHCESKHEQCCPSECSHDNGDDHQHDDKCPADHHHHCGTCLHQIPLGMENDLISRLPVPEGSSLELRPESERVPDGPFQALDKPPLI